MPPAEPGVTVGAGEEPAARADDLAVVLSGGGARAAYQVGVLRGVVQTFPELRLQIVTGVSAGAINAAFLASRTGPLVDRVDALSELWRGLRSEHVYRVELASLARNVVRWGVRLLSGGSRVAPRARALLDTSPLRELLRRELRAGDGTIPGIRENLERGGLRAVALGTVNYATGQTITWVQGRSIASWERPQRRGVTTSLCVEHVMASAALPLVFPAVAIDGAYHGDGGMRLAAPLSPAVHLGAGRILAISTRYDRTAAEAGEPAALGYPAPAQVAGLVMNAIFLDLVDQDAVRLEQFNTLLRRLPPDARGSFRPIRLTVLRPSRDLGRLAGLHEPQLPGPVRFLLRGLGSRETQSPDFLSLLLFEPGYVRELIRIGEADALAQRERLRELLEPPPAAPAG